MKIVENKCPEIEELERWLKFQTIERVDAVPIPAIIRFERKAVTSECFRCVILQVLYLRIASLLKRNIVKAQIVDRKISCGKIVERICAPGFPLDGADSHPPGTAGDLLRKR